MEIVYTKGEPIILNCRVKPDLKNVVIVSRINNFDLDEILDEWNEDKTELMDDYCYEVMEILHNRKTKV